MVDLSVNLSSLRLKNPILTASGTFGYGLEFAELVDLNKLGGIVLKTVSLEPIEGNPPPRLCEVPLGIINSVGLQNPGIEWLIDEILPKLKQFDTAIIASVIGFNKREFCELTTILNKDSRNVIKAIELNLSCPNIDEKVYNFYNDVSEFQELLKSVRNSSNHLPLIAKLRPDIYRVVEYAKYVEAAGIDIVSLINTIPAMAINWRKKESLISRDYGGYSGPCIKPIALKLVFDVANNVKIPVIGIGGITKVDDVLDFLCVGAQAVEIGSFNFVEHNIAEKLVDEISEVLAKEKISSLSEIIHTYKPRLEKTKQTLKALKVYTDASYDHNTKSAGISFIIMENEKIIHKWEGKITRTTSNQAEYMAIISALQFIDNNKERLSKGGYNEIEILSDSELVINQINGSYKIHKVELYELYQEVSALRKKMSESFIIKFTYIPREENYLADDLSKLKPK